MMVSLMLAELAGRYSGRRRSAAIEKCDLMRPRASQDSGLGLFIRL
jgi:hypothetical protein